LRVIKTTRWFLLLLLPILTSIGHAAEPSTTLRVFYTGHSFHMFVPERMSRLAETAGIDAYKLAGTQSLGGSRVEQHWNLPEDKNQAKKILASAQADVFTMAPNVQMPDDGIERFAELGLKHNPQIRLLVQESWVPGDYLEKRISSNAQRDETDLTRLRADQQAWRGQMEAQAKAINAKAGRQAVSIVPAGDAVVQLRELVAQGKVPGIAKQSELFNDTIGHANAPILLLTAYCNFACITGRSPRGIKVSENGVSDELNAMLQQIAWETVTTYPLSGVRPSE
jgi:hypothetical protein